MPWGDARQRDGRRLADPTSCDMLTTSELNALQRTFLSSFRAVLPVCAVCSAVGIGAALVRGIEETYQPS
jgi:hypothetical protein